MDKDKNVKPRYTKEELEALLEKEEHPDREVHCPRCGNELLFEDRGSAFVVRCSQSDCLKAVGRGL